MEFKKAVFITDKYFDIDCKYVVGHDEENSAFLFIKDESYIEAGEITTLNIPIEHAKAIAQVILELCEEDGK